MGCSCSALGWCGCSVTTRTRACGLSIFTLLGAWPQRAMAANTAKTFQLASSRIMPTIPRNLKDASFGSTIDPETEMKSLYIVAASLAALVTAYGAEKSAAGDYFVYVGTYTASVSKGIYAFRFQPSTGK